MKPDDFRIPPEQPVDLAAYSPDATGKHTAEDAARAYATAQMQQLRRYGHIFHTHARYGLLVLIQGMDGAGKDETIQTIFTVFDPQVCHARQFKAPTEAEGQHDYLWRAVQALPARGHIAVFNRSYYEQVTAEQVYEEQIDQWGLPSEACENLWDKRYAQINNFERHLVENGFLVLKFFLHISKETERQRLLERIERPGLQAEFSESDLKHHRDWDAFQRSYAAMLSRTSTPWAPWYLVPSNQRWYTYAAVASVLLHHFKALHADYPTLDDATGQMLGEARIALEQEQGA